MFKHLVAALVMQVLPAARLALRWVASLQTVLACDLASVVVVVVAASWASALAAARWLGVRRPRLFAARGQAMSGQCSPLQGVSPLPFRASEVHLTRMPNSANCAPHWTCGRRYCAVGAAIPTLMLDVSSARQLFARPLT